jgi:hypothetical protein
MPNENSNDIDIVYAELSKVALSNTEENLKNFFLNRMLQEQDSTSWHFITRHYDGTLRFVTYIDYGINEINDSISNPIFNKKNYKEELQKYTERIKIDNLNKKEIEDVFRKTSNLFSIKSKKDRIDYLSELKIFVLAYSYNQLMLIENLKTKK